MNPQEIFLVRTSFRQLRPIAGRATALFYARLFELDPSLRSLFEGGMQEHGRELLELLTTVIDGLDRPEKILPAARELGVRHARLGLHYKHYAAVRSALLWTLAKGLGSDFTPEIREAWNAVYATLAGTMIDAGEAAA